MSIHTARFIDADQFSGDDSWNNGGGTGANDAWGGGDTRADTGGGWGGGGDGGDGFKGCRM